GAGVQGELADDEGGRERLWDVVPQNDDSCVFFFQAEDGIRDKLVTGVQTCALPISSASASCAARRVSSPESASMRAAWGQSKNRSEERRVGKECRSRWLPYE